MKKMYSTKIKSITATLLIAIFVLSTFAMVMPVITNALVTDPPTQVTADVDYTSVDSGTAGSIYPHSCSIVLVAEAKKESIVSGDGRLWYGEKHPGSKWEGTGVFIDHDWTTEGCLTAILNVKTGRIHPDTDHGIIALYGKAKVYIDSKHVGNYDFDLVLVHNNVVVFVLYTIPEVDGETAFCEEQPTWFGPISEGEIVFS